MLQAPPARREPGRARIGAPAENEHVSMVRRDRKAWEGPSGYFLVK